MPYSVDPSLPWLYFLQAKGHAESLNLSLVGYYQACERLDDTALAPVGERVAEQIRSQFDDAIAFVVKMRFYVMSPISLCSKVDGDSLGSGEAALIVSFIHLSAALFPSFIISRAISSAIWPDDVAPTSFPTASVHARCPSHIGESQITFSCSISCPG